MKIQSPSTGLPNTREVGKVCDVDRFSRYLSGTIQDRDKVTMENTKFGCHKKIGVTAALFMCCIQLYDQLYFKMLAIGKRTDPEGHSRASDIVLFDKP